MTRIFGPLLTACLVLLTWHGAAAPVVLITNLPPYGSTANLEGLVLGANPQTCRIAAFIYVPGYGWVTKPTCAEPLTQIRADGAWSADITTGISDAQATRVAALLVNANFNQPCVLGSAFLTNAFGAALAAAVVTRQDPGHRWVRFGGYDWWVKSSAGKVGPGPNYFSDSTNNVWVDALGQLHLRLTNRANQWQCAEIVSARNFGYGSYRFELNSRVDNLSSSVVLGLFTWSDDPAYAHREIDFEASRWGNNLDPYNSQFVVQPYDTAGHLVRFTVPAVSNTTAAFTWETNRILFQFQRGSYSAGSATNQVSAWNYAPAVPRPGDENVRLNLWLNGGAPPTDGREAEIVIKSFTFTPPGSGAPALITNPGKLPNQSLKFQITTEPDRHYLVQSSTDCGQWQDRVVLLATNTSTPFVETAPNPARLFRVVTLP